MPNKDHGKTASKRPHAKYPDAVLAKGQPIPLPVGTLPSQYKGEHCTIQRDAQAADAGFVAGSDQVLVIFDDGSSRLVKRSEVS